MAEIFHNGQGLTPNGKLANQFLSRLMGLMGRLDLPRDFCLVLIPCSSIHMAFMKIPLDIAYLNRQGVVIALQWDLKPWKIGEIHPGTYAVLEAPVDGVLRRLAVGDQISWQ